MRINADVCTYILNSIFKCYIRIQFNMKTRNFLNFSLIPYVRMVDKRICLKIV